MKRADDCRAQRKDIEPLQRKEADNAQREDEEQPQHEDENTVERDSLNAQFQPYAAVVEDHRKIKPVAALSSQKITKQTYDFTSNMTLINITST